MNFAPRNKALWDILAKEIGTHANQRISLVDKYYKMGGRFTDTEPKSQHIATADTLFERSITHNWRQYIGHTPFVANATNIKIQLPAQLIIQPASYFGIFSDLIGYQLLIPDNQESVLRIPRKVGYALMSISRELTVREAKFTCPPDDYPPTVFLKKGIDK